MHKRFLTLLVLVVLVGVATHAFGQGVPQDQPITRAGAVALIVEANPALKTRLQHHIRTQHPLPLFDDIDYAQWYAPYVETAFEAGLIAGNAQGRFRPGDLMAEEEAIALAARYRAMTNPAMAAEMTVQDESQWFTQVLNASVRNGIQVPSPVRVGQPITRGSLYAMMLSMNVASPESITLSYQPTPVPQIITAIAPAVTTRPRPVAQQPRPVVTQPRPVQVAQVTPPPAQPVSQKAFAISMPTLGIKDLTITHPTDPFTKDGLHAPLKYGVGHLFSYPGKGGKILVYGHSSSYPWDVSKYTKIFRQINKLQVGEKIYVTYNGQQHVYQVSHKQTVPAADMSAYQGGGGEELILYTCWPPDSIKERYLVHAKPVQEVAAR